MKRRTSQSVGFTLAELLVVVSIIALLAGILLPALQKARRSARFLLNANNQRVVTVGVSSYATDNRGRFPPSVATLGSGTRWSWREPTVLTAFQQRSPDVFRSVSQYLRGYIERPQPLFCPGAPSPYEFAEEAWAAGDAWDHPDLETDDADPLFGNYCLYWNYVGYLENSSRPFVGPHSLAGRRGRSRLLLSDYFGYGHWRNELTYGHRNAYGSCERMARADITEGTAVACDYWSLPRSLALLSPDDTFRLALNAAYVDGHVERFTAADVIIMKVAMTTDGSVPYPDTVGPGGVFYLPRSH